MTSKRKAGQEPVSSHYNAIAGMCRGIRNHDDATRHFGSLLAFDYWERAARRVGAINHDGRLTPFGEALAEWAEQFPEGRAYFWQGDREGLARVVADHGLDPEETL